MRQVNYTTPQEAVECAQMLANEQNEPMYVVQHEDVMRVYMKLPAYRIAMTVEPAL